MKFKINNLMIFYFMIIMVFGLFFHYTPLSRAIYLENMEIVKLLLSNPNIVLNLESILNQLFYDISNEYLNNDIIFKKI